MKLGVRCELRDSLEDFFGGPRDQQIRASSKDSVRDVSDLLGGLALAKDDFGKAEPQFAMMIHARELDVLIRKLSELVGGLVDIYTARPRVFEKLFDQISIHFGDSSTRVLRWRMQSRHKGTKSRSCSKRALWSEPQK